MYFRGLSLGSLFLDEMQIKNPGMAVTPSSPSAGSFEPAENMWRESLRGEEGETNREERVLELK